MLDELAKIRFARFRFRLRAETPLRLPPYKGSTLRGGFGIAFKEAVCVVAHRDCARCILRTKCAYPYIFETPIPEGSRRMASLEYAPHPFVIEPPLDEKTDYAEGETLEFGLILIGRAVHDLPYFVLGFEELGRRWGIGKTVENARQDALRGSHGGEEDVPRGESFAPRSRARGASRGRFSVESVTAPNGAGETVVYDGRARALRSSVSPCTVTDVPHLSFHPARLHIEFLTPTRLVFDRHLVAVPEFHKLVRSLLRRLANLAYFHCGSELDLEFRDLVDTAERVELTDDRTRWHDWERYSARQDAKLRMGGLVGESAYEGHLEPFAPLLALGQILHVGKGTGLGLGRFRARGSGR